MNLASLVRDIPDFPVKGVLFKDITTLLQDPQGLKQATDTLADHYRGQEIDIVAGIESRGFIFGTPLALALGAGFVPVRKPGKLPAESISIEYSLEYGTNTLEMHVDAINPGQRVLLVDDLLATGGSAEASISLIEQLGGEVVSTAFVIELLFLHGREKLAGHDVFSVIQY